MGFDENEGSGSEQDQKVNNAAYHILMLKTWYGLGELWGSVGRNAILVSKKELYIIDKAYGTSTCVN